MVPGVEKQVHDKKKSSGKQKTQEYYANRGENHSFKIELVIH
jgi:hypothetical protein